MADQQERVDRAERVVVVGIGDSGLSGLTGTALSSLESADVIVGTEANLALLKPELKARGQVLGTDIGELVRRIDAASGERFVVLATGDPLFYGIARLLCDRLGKEAVAILPHVSSMQLAFARIKESWDEAYLTDAARHPLETIVDRVRSAERVGLFTDDRMTPPSIARALLAEGIDYFDAYVCENLGTRNEVITQGSLAEIAGLDFGPLNVMVLIRRKNVPDQRRTGVPLKLFGNPDELFRQSRPKRGLLTPAEIRTMALGALALRPNSVVWDVGAGSGSVAIEAARLAHSGHVYAIEPDTEDGELIRDNAALFEVNNITVVAGLAPAAFADLPTPNSIFMGGLGRDTLGVLEPAFAALASGGTLVANVAALEVVAEVVAALKARTEEVDINLINIARGTHQLEQIRFESLNPSFLVSASKPTT